MKYRLTIVIVLILTLYMQKTAHATEILESTDFDEINNIISSVYDKEFDFKKNVENILNGYTDENQNIFSDLLSYIVGEIKVNLKSILFLIAFSVFAGFIVNFQSSFSRRNVADIAFLSIYFVYIYILASSYKSCYELAKNTLKTQISLIEVSTPLYVTTVAATGHVSTATAINAIFLYLIHICTQLIENVLFPLNYWVFLLTTVNNASDKIQISKIISLLKQTINWILGFSMTVFVSALSLSGLKGATVDRIGIKTIKYSMGNFVPVVGRLLSDTLDTVVSSATLLKNSVGIVGIIAICLISIYPYIKLLVITWLYRLAAGIIEPVSERKLSNLVSGAASSIQIMSTMILIVSMTLVLSLGIIIALCN